MTGETEKGGRNQLGLWLGAMVLLGLTTGVVFFGIYLYDWWNWTPTPERLAEVHLTAKPGVFDYFAYDTDTAQNALGTLAQVITAILGIVITVVSIVVQLASTRYTPRVAEMFFRDRTNLLVLGYFVVAGIDAIWVSLSVTHIFVPTRSITLSLMLVTSSVLMLVPYFAYVFDFLDPEKVVTRIQEQALGSALAGTRVRRDVVAAQSRVLLSIEQLGDIATNAVAQKDKLIAQGAVEALKVLAVKYLPAKKGAEAAWFTVGPHLRRNPDFVSMSPYSVDEIARQRMWVEWKVLRQFQAVVSESLSEMPDMSHVVAISTRYVGEAALECDDREVLALVVKFFNTYLRATLNAEQVRTAYNTMNQYRQLIERVIAAGRDEVARAVAGYFRYYSVVANQKGMAFIIETIAYDLATLCEHAHAQKVPCHDGLLAVLLELDRPADTAEQERSLRGVRKAQAKLASYYLAAGDETHARTIFEDMKEEPADRLSSILNELLAISSKEFWEVIDRGTNFDYMDDARKRELRRFFSWFPALAAAAAAAAAPV